MSDHIDHHAQQLEELTLIDEAIISSIGEAVIIVDPKGITVRANVSAGRILGINQTELVGNDLASRLHFYSIDTKQQIAPHDMVVEQAITHRSIIEDRYMVPRSNASTVYVHATASPVVVKGVVYGVVLTMRDVTHEVLVDQAKTEFVSIASHQLRTPLSTINWYLEMVLAQDFGEINERQRELIQEAYDSSQRMGELIDALLSVSRIDVGAFAISPQPTNIASVVEQVIQDLQDTIQHKRIAVDTKDIVAGSNFMLDPSLMHIIFLNLISNAVKYTPEEGRVAVRVSASDQIHISVADTGYGIPAQQQDKIFSKLFRASNAVEREPDGTGLGLYIVKSIVDEVGGNISFISHEGQGTTFTIILPIEGMATRKGTKELSADAGA